MIQMRHREERSDVAIQGSLKSWIASPSARNDEFVSGVQ
jgi:hypothetical protein